MRQALAIEGKDIDIHYNETVHHIKIEDERFLVETGGTCYQTRALVVCAGGHSLKLAQDLGYGLHYSCLPVAGSYYFTPQNLNGKVYTVQNDKLPFAERYNYRTMPDFLRVFRFGRRVAKVLWDLFRVADIRNYMLKNILFEVPVIRKFLFLRDVRKIIPSLRWRDLTFARKVGGIRPQLIDKIKCVLLMGEAKINPGNGVIFNMTPSPGGTSCMENAEIDMRMVAKHLGATINEDALKSDLLGEDKEHGEEDFTGRLLEDSGTEEGLFRRISRRFRK